MLIFIIIHGLVQLHFCFVTYTHWKNADKDLGGVSGNAEIGTIDDMQMRQIEN